MTARLIASEERRAVMGLGAPDSLWRVGGAVRAAHLWPWILGLKCLIHSWLDRQ